MWTATLIEALSLMGVGEPNARQAAARLSDDLILTPVRHGRATHWDLTPRGQRLLTTGAQRIYEFGASSEEWDGQWLMVLTSVAEEMRAKRRHVRAQLQFAGFGFLSAGVAVSPHAEREKDAEAIVAALDLNPRALVLAARTGSATADAEIIRRAWDLEVLAAKYGAFVAEFGRVRPASGPACFTALVSLVHEWRRFPFEDPEIPLELLPARWPGRRAKTLFDDRRAVWSEGAQKWFRDLDSRRDTSTDM